MRKPIAKDHLIVCVASKKMVNQTTTMTHFKGNYTYVGLDIDTTGRRLIDEIVHIAAYTAEDQYAQYIMPLMNLNPGARQRHQIRVINVGCFRMLKSMQTYKVIKTKTEIAALLEFLDWLESINKKDGIIFVYHDQLKFTPYMVIEAMKKYRLMDRFESIVKSFVNGYDLAGEKQGGSGIRYLSLSQNYKVQLEKLNMESKDPLDFEGDATVRAKLSYDIVMLMAHGGEKKEVEPEAMAEIVNEFIREKARAINSELDEITEQEECIKRQSTLREIFRGYFQASRYHRRRAVTFRRLLAEASHDLESLEKTWNEGKQEAVVEEVKKLKDLSDEDRDELAKILDAHFDPEKKPEKPIVARRENNNGGNVRNQRRRRPRGRSVNKENRGPRSNSNRKRSADKRYNNNSNNNNNVMSKTGNMRKNQQVDSNQNPALIPAN